MLDRVLLECVDRAIVRLTQDSRNAPASAEALVTWTTRLSSTRRARDYFDGARAIIFLLPWWLEQRIQPIPDIHFQELLVDSTVNAYYFIRIIDNVMDENAAEERALLPLTGILHANFIRAYSRVFSSDDPFWEEFDLHWGATADAALLDNRVAQFSASDFVEIAARKTAGIKIPLAAVCCRYGRLDLLHPWYAFYDRFACWQQMLNDTFGWMRDLRYGNATFFLSEGQRQKRCGESVSGWAIRCGVAWAIDWLDALMRDLRRDAAWLDSPELIRFLEYRDKEVQEYAGDLRRQLEDLAIVADVFEPVELTRPD